MKFYRLQCLNEDGNIERNGYFLKRENAVKRKTEMDSWKMNTRYGIVQDIIEVETED